MSTLLNELKIEPSETVLVTGASSFVGSHIIKLLLQDGYSVRGTMRDLNKTEVIDQLNQIVVNPKQKLELVAADLKNEQSWLKPVKDCAFVIHVASVIPKSPYDDPKEIIDVTVNGALNVLKACMQTGSQVKRVVMTSSVTAIAGDNLVDGKVYTEKDWPDVNKQYLYAKSKILSEKAAWDFMKEHNNPFELSVINPGYILGPLLLNNINGSLETIKQLLLREFPFIMVPDIYMPCCDVRDVALAHIRAMKLPGAAFERHIITNSYESPSFKQWADILDAEFGKKYAVPTKVSPHFFVRVYSLFNETINEKSVNLGKRTFFDNKRMTDVLLIQPIDLKKTLVDTVNSMIERNLIPKSKGYFF